MNFRMETIEGNEFLIFEKDTSIHKIPMEAIASWGVLLGLTDPVDVVAAILRFQETPVSPGEPNLWTPLYAALDEGLTEMSKAGVPPEHMPDLLDPTLKSPVPGPEVLGRFTTVQEESLAAINSHPDDWGPLSQGVAAALDKKLDTISEAKTAFVDNLAPVYVIEQQTPPASLEDAMAQLNLRTDSII